MSPCQRHTSVSCVESSSSSRGSSLAAPRVWSASVWPACLAESVHSATWPLEVALVACLKETQIWLAKIQARVKSGFCRCMHMMTMIHIHLKWSVDFRAVCQNKEKLILNSNKLRSPALKKLENFKNFPSRKQFVYTNIQKPDVNVNVYFHFARRIEVHVQLLLCWLMLSWWFHWLSSTTSRQQH